MYQMEIALMLKPEVSKLLPLTGVLKPSFKTLKSNI